jgi:hypothetical protein
MKTFPHLWQYFTKFLIEWEMFYIKVLEKVKTHILCSIPSFRKSCPLWVNVEKLGGARGHKWLHTTSYTFVSSISKTTCKQASKQARTHARTHANAHAHAPGHRHMHVQTRAHTHKPINNSYCFSTTTIIRERAPVLRYTHIALYLCVRVFMYM